MEEPRPLALSFASLVYRRLFICLATQETDAKRDRQEVGKGTAHLHDNEEAYIYEGRLINGVVGDNSLIIETKKVTQCAAN